MRKLGFSSNESHFSSFFLAFALIYQAHAFLIQGLGNDFTDVLVDGTIKNIKCTFLWGPIDMLVDSDSRKSSVGTRNAFPHAGQGSADFLGACMHAKCFQLNDLFEI